MTALLVVLMFVAFVLTDVVVRVVSRRLGEARARREREEVLVTSLKLDFTPEARSLKRVDVPNPRARILAVDDEPIILDSFRKILVLAGFSVDTVESGPEALGLIQRRDYDFVFTDLKMPGMDGVEVVKAVRHLRPDVDIAVITGYATIETAVETMQHGAVDYVQKPFTEEELLDFARRLVIKREARLEAHRRPTVRLVTPALAETASNHEFCVPGGAFVAEGHTWARIEPGGEVRIGLDDFARKALRSIREVALPRLETKVRRGEPLFALRQADREIWFPAPLSGQVIRLNDPLIGEPSRVTRSPYDRGWICLIRPSDLAGELPTLRIGQPVVAWYQEEIACLRESGGAGGEENLADRWDVFQKKFLPRDFDARGGSRRQGLPAA